MAIKSATITIPPLRSVNDIKDEFDALTGEVVRRVSDVVVLMDKSAQSLQNHPGFKRLNVGSAFDYNFGPLNSNLLLFKYNSVRIPHGTPALTPDVAGGSSADTGIRISVLNTDSGWSDALAPTSAEIKSYFYGWKMCHSDGASPYYKSEVPYNPETWAGWSKSGNVTFNASGAEFTFGGGLDLILPTDVKTSTKYGIIHNIVTNTLLSKLLQLKTELTTAQNFVTVGQTGNRKLIFTTNAAITTNQFRVGDGGAGDPGAIVKLKDIRIFELPPGSQIEADFNNLTADELNIKYKFYGENQKHWKQLVGTEQEIADSITDVMPTESYAGFTPYKMMYELAEPVIEQLEGWTPLPTYPRHTVIKKTDYTPAPMEMTATIKVEDY